MLQIPKGPEYSLPRALGFIFLSMCVVCFSFWLIVKLKDNVRQKRNHDSKYLTQVLVQSCPSSSTLSSPLLSKILEVSANQPLFLDQILLEEKIQKLESFGVFDKLEIKKLNTRGLWVHHQLKEPLFFCGNFSNTSLDQKGSLFAHDPFFKGRNLPKVYFSEQILSPYQSPWNKQVPSETMDLVLKIKQELSQFEIQAIDLSRIDQHSLGICEIIVHLKDPMKHLFLRLSPFNIEKGISHFHLLYDKVLRQIEKDVTVELRLSQLALWSL